MRISHFRAFAKIDPTLARGPLATLFIAALLSVAPLSVYVSRATIALVMLLAFLSYLAARAEGRPLVLPEKLQRQKPLAQIDFYHMGYLVGTRVQLGEKPGARTVRVG